MRKLNKEEEKAIDLTVELWSVLNKLSIVHQDDLNEHRADIHNIQNRIIARPFVENQQQNEKKKLTTS